MRKRGCLWRHFPFNYVPWATVYWYFRKWTLEGIIEAAYRELPKALQKKNGRKRMSSISGQQRGIDGNKKIKGSKRHIIVDTMSLIKCIVAHAANVHDSKGAKEVFDCLYDYVLMKTRWKKYLQMGDIKERLPSIQKRK